MKPLYRMTIVLTLALTAMAGALTAMAGQAMAAELKQAIEVDGEVIRLGDLLTDTRGAAAATVVADAPAPGATAYITINDINAAARKAGITWQRPVRLSRVAVARSGRKISRTELEMLIAAEMRGSEVSGEFRVNLFGRSQNITLPAGGVPGDIMVDSIDLDLRSERFIAYLNIPLGAGETRKIDLQGRVERVATLPVLAHEVPPGEIIRKGDIRWITVPLRQAGRNVLRSSADLIGMTPRRNLVPGRTLRSGDIERLALVHKGARISLSYRIGNLKISAQGRALQRGGDGDIIRVLNTNSNKTVEAIITGPNQAEVLHPGVLTLASR